MVVEIGFLVFYIVPIILRASTHTYQRKTAKKEIIKNLEESGYDVNKHYINRIFDFFDSSEDEYLYESSSSVQLALTIFPLINYSMVYFDIKYLLGDHTCEPYWDDFSSLNKKKLKYLLKNDVIKENKEKIRFIKDKNNALKELEKKYKNIETPKNTNMIIISENDSEKELYEKLERLQEMILRKTEKTSDEEKKLIYEPKKK